MSSEKLEDSIVPVFTGNVMRFRRFLGNEISRLSQYEGVKSELEHVLRHFDLCIFNKPRPMADKSVQGLRPKAVWLEDRHREINEAVDRCIESGVRPETAWFAELIEIEEQLASGGV